MKKTRQIIAFLLSVLMIMPMAFSTGVTAFAEETDILGYLKYEITDGEVTIVKCDTSVSGDIVIPATIEDSPVTAIGVAAFSSCSNITSIELPESVKTIGKDSFYWCDKLVSINIPDGVTTIGDNAFYYCRSLENITIPDGVTIIDENTFNYCTSLESVTIGNGVETIGKNAFYWCEKLSEVVIPDSVTTLDTGAFMYCAGLTSVTIGKNVTTIGNFAFYGCENLPELIIPYGVTTIGNEAFWNCKMLANVTVSDSVKTIGDKAFGNCSSLTSITIPYSVTSIGASVFSGCSSLSYIDVSENNGNYSCDEYGVLFNKDKTELIKYPVGNSITEYEIPDTVEVIHTHSFSYSKKLKYITISASVATIEDNAFVSCDNLISFTVDEKNSSYLNDEYGVLYNKDKTELMHYPKGSSTTEYVIPDSVTAIGANTFASCTKLTSITIGNSVESIGDEAFYYCYNLKNITLPISVGSVGSWAFGSCRNLESISILNPDCSINDKTYTIPSAATIYGYPGSTAEAYATKYSRTFVALEVEDEFEVFENFTYEVVDGVVTIIACDKSAEGEVVIPETIGEYPVTAIGEGAFDGCTLITEIMIPDSVTVISSNTFNGCTALEKVVASGVETIAGNAFAGCSALDTVITFADSLTVADNAFNINENILAFVKDNAEITAPDTLNVITFSFADGVLSFKGDYKSDLYYLFDLVTVMCAYYDGVDYLFFDLFEVVSADEGHIYYYTEDWERIEFDGTKVSNVKFAVEAFDGEEFRNYSFNELCEKAVAGEIDNFNLVVEEADGLDKGSVEISLVDQINMMVQRILKAITNLFNKLFSFFRKFGKK